MSKLTKNEWVIVTGLLMLSLIPSIGGILRLTEIGIGSGSFWPENPRIELAPVPVVLHIVSSVPFCIFGAFQFLGSVRRGNPLYHRLAGRFLAASGMVSAFSCLWMTHFYSFPGDLQGGLLYVTRLAVGGGMVMCIVLGVVSILKLDVTSHRAWMIRSYALGQGAGTQVFIAIPWFLTIGEPSGVLRDILMTSAWVINMVIAEYAVCRECRSAVQQPQSLVSASMLH